MKNMGLEVVGRVESEFREMPGLSLDRRQAQKLFGLDEAAVAQVLDHLVTTQVLMRHHNGTYKLQA